MSIPTPLRAPGAGVPPLTSEGTLVPGPVVRQGTETPYRVLTTGPGEPHLVRGELTGGLTGGASGEAGGRGPPVIAFTHVADLQLADVQSPGRFEFCERYAEDPRFQLLVPMHRPQEALTGRAADAMVRTLNGLTHGPVTGADLELVVTTGDAIDNAQWNELQ